MVCDIERSHRTTIGIQTPDPFFFNIWLRSPLKLSNPGILSLRLSRIKYSIVTLKDRERSAMQPSAHAAVVFRIYTNNCRGQNSCRHINLSSTSTFQEESENSESDSDYFGILVMSAISGNVWWIASTASDSDECDQWMIASSVTDTVSCESMF